VGCAFWTATRTEFFALLVVLAFAVEFALFVVVALAIFAAHLVVITFAVLDAFREIVVFAIRRFGPFFGTVGSVEGSRG
jgi:hypothetical protein